jgi:hypothetical protein
MVCETTADYDSFQLIVTKRAAASLCSTNAFRRNSVGNVPGLEYDTECRVDVLTRETSGNQAISIVLFTVGRACTVWDATGTELHYML